FQEGTAKTFSGASTAPIPLGSALPSQGTEAIYSVETAAITPRSTPSKNIEAKTNVAPAVSVPPAPVSVPSALRQGERVERSGSRRRLPVVIVLLLILAGGLTYRARHEKPRAAEIPPPPTPPAVSTQAGQANKPAEKADKTEKSDQTEKPDQSA